MYLVLSVIVIIICILMILIVLVQNQKGGGLSANFTSAGQTMGVRRTTDFLEKSTWTMAVALMLFSIVAGILSVPKRDVEQRSVIEDQIQNVIDPNAIPTFPTSPPQDAGSGSGDQNQ